MILKKGNKKVYICNNCLCECLYEKELVLVNNIHQGECNDCYVKRVHRYGKQPNPVKRLKWWIILFEYEEKGYKLVRR